MSRPNPGPRDRSNYFVSSTINMVRSFKFSYIKQMSRMRNKDLNVVSRRGAAKSIHKNTGGWTIGHSFNLNFTFVYYFYSVGHCF